MDINYLLKVIRHHVTIAKKNSTSRHFLAEFYKTNVVSIVQFQFFFLLQGTSIWNFINTIHGLCKRYFNCNATWTQYHWNHFKQKKLLCLHVFFNKIMNFIPIIGSTFQFKMIKPLNVNPKFAKYFYLFQSQPFLIHSNLGS